MDIHNNMKKPNDSVHSLKFCMEQYCNNPLAVVAQWIARRIQGHKIVGSSPAFLLNIFIVCS